MTYTAPTLGNEVREIKRRLAKLERGISRNLIFTGGGGVHIPGELTVGSGSDGWGSGNPIVGGVPDAPASISATPGADATDSYVDIGWPWPTPPPTITQFEVRYKRSGDSEYTYRVVSTNLVRLSQLIPGTTYKVNVRSISSIGMAGPWYDNGTDIDAIAGTDTTAPGQVTGLTVATGFSTMMATWNERTEADLDKYRLQVSTNSGFTGIVYDQYIYSNVVSVDDLNAATTYYWRVRAVDKAGNEGTWSTTSSGSTQLIDSAFINSLVASKITTGTMAATVITLGNTSAARIQSFDTTSMVIRGDGYAKFANVEITGLATGGMSVGSGSSIFKVDNTGNIWSGNASYGSAPFRVSNLGALRATSGLFGNTSGSYFEITSTYLGFVYAGAARGKIDYSSSYGNSVVFTAHTGSGISLNEATLILSGDRASLYGGLGQNLYLGTVDSSSSPSSNVFVDAVASILLDTADVILDGSTSVTCKANGFVTAVIEQQPTVLNGRIQINGASTGDEGGELILLTATGGGANCYIDNWKTGATNYLRFHNGSTVLGRIRQDTPIYDLDVSAGSNKSVYINSSGTFGYNSSSRRFKTDLVTIERERVIKALREIRGLTYLHVASEGGEYGKRYLGFIAEEMHEHFPEATALSPDGKNVDTIDYGHVVPVVWEIMRWIDERLELVEARV